MRGGIIHQIGIIFEEKGGMKKEGMGQRAIRLIRDILQTKYEPERIILFGSYATGRQALGSDIDLLIVKRTSQPFHRRLAEVRQLVSSCRRGIPFDPIVITPQELNRRIIRGDQFLANILRSGKVLYAKP